MTPETKIKIAKTLSLVVVVWAVSVMVGWIADIGILKCIHPAWQSMKFGTAIAFVLSGIILYFIARAGEGHWDTSQVVLSVTTLILLLLMGLFFFSDMLNIHTGTEDLFVKETAPSVNTVVPGRPSFPTTLNFILIGIAGIITIMNPDKLSAKLKIIGLVVMAIGAVAVIGYALDLPILYYYLDGINSAIACNTALLFILSGIGLLCL